MKALSLIALFAVITTCAPFGQTSPPSRSFDQRYSDCLKSWPAYPLETQKSSSGIGGGTGLSCAGVRSSGDSARTVFAFYKTALGENGWTVSASDSASGVIWFASATDQKLGGRVIVGAISHGTLIDFLITNNCPCGPAAK